MLRSRDALCAHLSESPCLDPRGLYPSRAPAPRDPVDTTSEFRTELERFPRVDVLQSETHHFCQASLRMIPVIPNHAMATCVGRRGALDAVASDPT